MRLEYVGGGSAKFWEAERTGASVVVRWGRIGTAGQAKTRDFADEPSARDFLDKQAAEKTRKGYRPAGQAQSTQADQQPQAGQQTAPGGQEGQQAAQQNGLGGQQAVPVGQGVVPDGQQVEPVGGGVAVVGQQEMPDEDAFAPGLLAQALPRRDQGVQPRKSDTRRRQKFVEFLDERRGTIRGAVDNADARLREAALRYLDGEADPLGAAAVATAIEDARGWRGVDMSGVVGAGWVEVHGPAFAAAACSDLLLVEAQHARKGFRLGFRSGDSARLWQWVGDHPVVTARIALAGASEDEHAAAVAALAERRETPRRRAVAAFLAPTETAWVEDSLADLAAADAQDQFALAMLLVCAVSTPDQLTRLADQITPWLLGSNPRAIATLLRSVGPAAVPSMAAHLADAYAEQARKILAALAGTPTDEAFDLLLDRIDQKYVPTAVQEAMKRYPRRALRLLAARSTRSAAQLLRAHLVTFPDLDVDLPAGSAARVAAAREAGKRLPDAPVEALPPVLATPPWTRKRATAKPIVLDLPVPDVSEVRWAEGEHEEWTALVARHRYNPRGQDWRSVIGWFRAGNAPYYVAADILLSAPMELALPAVREWRPSDTWSIERWGRALVARFGVDAIEPLLSSLANFPFAGGVAALGPVFDARVAALMADFHVRLKSVRPAAAAWLARHGAAAVPLLAPAALGAPGKARVAAESAIRAIARQVGDEAVLAAVDPQAEAGIAALLARDPLTELPARLPKVGDWADPALLPQIKLRGGGTALSVAATKDVLTMLALGKPGEPYAGVEQVVAACEPLSTFAWGVFERWQAAGYPSKDGWVMAALGVLGDDDTVRALAPLIRTWPGEGGHQRVVAGLDVLAAIGTDVALLHLNGIAQKVKFSGLKTRAKEKIAQVAADLGLSAEQLADRLVPDFGLEADGSMVLDYGPRQFTVGFDEQLKPYVSDMDGTRRKVLPRPAAKDDPDLAPAAYQRFAALKKDVRTVADDQIRRLEQAMVAQRRWSGQEFTDLFVKHPLLWHVVRRLVWAVYGETTTGFRVAEDRTLADVDDEPFTLPADAQVGVAHPLHLGESLPAWAELFADYEILQPFPQLGRPIHALTDDERKAGLTRFDGAKVSTGRVLTLVRRGWQRGEPQDAGVEPWIIKPLPDGRVVVAHLDPGIVVGEVMAFPDQVLDSVRVGAADAGYYWPDRQTRELTDLDPVTESELLADLTEVFTA
ncbi:DUF4132 domain-containing protein [Actinokineospora sp. NPDC004072]